MFRDHRGFSLVEVLIATAILGITMVALSSMQGNAIRGNMLSRRANVATVLAQEKMEELRALSWENAWDNQAHQLYDSRADNFSIDTNHDGVNDAFDWDQTADHDNSEGPTGVDNPIDERGVHVTSDNPNAGYTRTWNVADNVPGPDMKTIAVRVQWRTGDVHFVVLESVISETTD